MSQPPRDWDKELAAIDRVMATTPAAQPPATAAPRAPAPPADRLPAPVPGVGPRQRMATWGRVLVTVALAVALPFWPYGRACGLDLALYGVAVAVTGLSGLWAARSAWARRQGFAHVLALLVLTWSLALAARELLPRTGYAKQPASWRCG